MPCLHPGVLHLKLCGHPKKMKSNYPEVQETCSYNCSKSILPLVYLLAIFHHGMFFPSPYVSSFSLNHHRGRFNDSEPAVRRPRLSWTHRCQPSRYLVPPARPICTTCWEWSPPKKAYSRENMSGNPLKGTIFNRKYIWKKNHWFSGDHVCQIGEVETFSQIISKVLRVLKEYWMLF